MSAELPTLDELGRRMQAAVAAHRPARRRRRLVWSSALALMLAAAPATATMTGVFHPHGDVPADAADALTPADPAATGRKLRAQGYRVTWLLVDDAAPGAPSPTVSRRVSAPPPGTELLSVLAPDGRREIDPGRKHVLIEIAPAGSDILADHR